MAAWSDDTAWSVRDENRHFDGVAFYSDWRQEDAVVADLRTELRGLNDLLDNVVEAFGSVDQPLTAREAEAEIVHRATGSEDVAA